MEGYKLVMIKESDFDRLIEKVDDIHSKIDSGELKLLESTLDNDEFIKLMKISKRTAQTWRDDGVIAFHQYGNKIYYQLADIQDFLKRTRKPVLYGKK